MAISVGIAGWSIGRDAAASFPETGTTLERYAAILPVSEINSSFHRPHRASTWQRWRESVPENFRFSVKIPKTITHERKLVDCDDLLDSFLGEVTGLGDKLAVLLLQLPPKLDFNPPIVERFLASLQRKSSVQLVCEPRHASWFGPEADALLKDHRVARVAADPELYPGASAPGGWHGLHYYRLHGSPAIYRSSYSDRIDDLAARLQCQDDKDRPVWCIFDNTASSAAIGDALLLQGRLAG
jgi:uncharacterized protein YecE (DUF72 family)